MSNNQTDRTNAIIEALAAGQTPAAIAGKLQLSMAGLAAIIASPDLAAAIEQLRQLQALHESIALATARARAMSVLMQLIGDDSLPANQVEARARETRRKACADILRCRMPKDAKGGGRRDPNEVHGCRGLNEVKATLSCANESAPSWPSAGASDHGTHAPSDRARHVLLAEATSSTPPATTPCATPDPAPLVRSETGPTNGIRESRQQRRFRERCERKVREKAARIATGCGG